jgi:pyroglutamyl-peptidase
MRRALLVGFGPFPGAPINPSAQLVKALARRRRPALICTAHVLPTTYAAVDRELPRLLAAKPDVVLMFGLAGRRRQLCIEMQARNACSVLYPDAAGHRPRTSVLTPGGAAVLRGAAPFARLLGVLRRRRLPARLSRDAGDYLCNYAYWRALESAPDGRPLVQFVHIPAVSPASRRPSRGTPGARPLLGFAALVAAGEALLVTLVAASRH